MTELHIDILIELRREAQFGLSEQKLLDRLRPEGHRELALPQLQLALRELLDASLANSFLSPLSGKRWRIMARAEAVLAEEGLGQS
jgi:hypothetical protein